MQRGFDMEGYVWLASTGMSSLRRQVGKGMGSIAVEAVQSTKKADPIEIGSAMILVNIFLTVSTNYSCIFCA